MEPQKKTSSIIDTHYLANFNCPILFTAPHSKTLNRGGTQFGTEQEVHKREKMMAYIVVKMAALTQIKYKKGANCETGSFVIWGTQRKHQDADPNYLKEEMLEESIFHQCLHTWANKFIEYPLFHVDMHGKNDSQSKCEIQIGTKAFQRIFNEKDIIQQFQAYFDKKYENAFSNWEINGMKCTFNSRNPHFKGSWGHGIFTMADQSARMGIPSIQIQIPTSVREQLFKDHAFFEIFHECIYRVYIKVVKPYWKKLNKPTVNHKLIELVNQNISAKEMDQCLEELEEYEKKKQKWAKEKKNNT